MEKNEKEGREEEKMEDLFESTVCIGIIVSLQPGQVPFIPDTS